MKRGLIFFWVGVLLLAITTPAIATPTGPADGTFTAAIDFSSLRIEPVGANCRLTVQGTLTFSGRLAGEATAVTRALALRFGQAMGVGDVHAFVGSVAAQGLHALAGLHIPELDGAIRTATGQRTTVRSKIKRTHLGCVTAERNEAASTR